MTEPSLGAASVDEARARMLQGARLLGLETVDLWDGAGRVLGEAVLALNDQPPFDASAMDGYALLAGDASEAFAVIGESAAGRPFIGGLGPGQAVRIFTGARVPEGAVVVVQERATRTGREVRFAPTAHAGDFVRPKGGDFRAGGRLLQAGVRLDPWRIALAAAAGRAAVKAAIRPRVAVLSTGEEVRRPGAPLLEGQIYDSTGPALCALIAAWGGAPRPLEPAADDEEAIARAVEGARCDLVVTVGGASVGDHDVTKPALRRLGLVLAVDTVRLRPGKPTWFGRLADGRRVLGLPGNPASALVCAELFLRPLIMALQGAEPPPPEEAALMEPLPPTGPREHWMRARLVSQDGRLLVSPFPDQDSSLVAVFAEADALLGRPAGAPAATVGERVLIRRLDRL